MTPPKSDGMSAGERLQRLELPKRPRRSRSRRRPASVRPGACGARAACREDRRPVDRQRREQDLVEADRADRDRVRADRADRDRADRDRADRNRADRNRADRDRADRDRADRDRADRDRADRDRADRRRVRRAREGVQLVRRDRRERNELACCCRPGSSRRRRSGSGPRRVSPIVRHSENSDVELVALVAVAVTNEPSLGRGIVVAELAGAVRVQLDRLRVEELAALAVAGRVAVRVGEELDDPKLLPGVELDRALDDPGPPRRISALVSTGKFCRSFAPVSAVAAVVRGDAARGRGRSRGRRSSGSSCR